MPTPIPWTADSGVTADSPYYLADGSGPGGIQPPPAVWSRVQAMQAGDYNGDYKNTGDVFDIFSAGEFSNSALSYVQPGNPDYPLFGWMKIVPPSTPLYSWSLANGGASTLRNAPRRTVQ